MPTRLRTRPSGPRGALRAGATPAGFDSWDAALDAWGVPAEHRNDNAALVDPDGAGPRLYFQKVPEPKTAKNRVHLDLRAAAGVPSEGRADALEAECRATNSASTEWAAGS